MTEPGGSRNNHELSIEQVTMGTVIGAGLGAALGAAMDDTAVGLAIGIAIGLVFAIALNARSSHIDE